MSAFVRSAVCFGLAGLAFLDPASARAQEVDGAFRFQLSSDVFATEKLTITPKEDLRGEVEGTWTGLTLGSGIGASLGFAANENLVLALNLGMSSETTTIDDFDQKEERTIVRLLPRAEWLFGSGAARPYLLGTMGMRSVSTTSGDWESTSSGFVYGAGFGVHLFAAEHVTFSPEIAFLGMSGSGTIPGETTSGMESIDTDETGFRVQVGFSLGGWFGGATNRNAASNTSEPTGYGETASDDSATASGNLGAGSGPDSTGASSSSREPTSETVLGTGGSSVFAQKGNVVLELVLQELPTRFVGDPRVSGDVSNALVRLPNDPSECSEVAFVLGEERLPASKFALKRTNRASVLAVFSTDTLRRVAKHDGSALLEACGVVTDVSAGHRRAISKYLATFRVEAKKNGTWHEPGTQPAPSAAEPKGEDAGGEQGAASAPTADGDTKEPAVDAGAESAAESGPSL